MKITYLIKCQKLEFLKRESSEIPWDLYKKNQSCKDASFPIVAESEHELSEMKLELAALKKKLHKKE